jgi:hypothetical protein
MRLPRSIRTPYWSHFQSPSPSGSSPSKPPVPLVDQKVMLEVCSNPLAPCQKASRLGHLPAPNDIRPESMQLRRARMSALPASSAPILGLVHLMVHRVTTQRCKDRRQAEKLKKTPMQGVTVHRMNGATAFTSWGIDPDHATSKARHQHSNPYRSTQSIRP